MTTLAAISDADILEHVVTPLGGIDPASAHAILKLKFDKDATKTIRRLLQKNNRGAITADERVALGKFVRVGKLIDLLQAKARDALHKAGSAD